MQLAAASGRAIARGKLATRLALVVFSSVYFVWLFARAAWQHPLPATAVAAFVVVFCLAARWRVPSGEIDPREWPPDEQSHEGSF